MKKEGHISEKEFNEIGKLLSSWPTNCLKKLNKDVLDEKRRTTETKNTIAQRSGKGS